jgi:chitinase
MRGFDVKAMDKYIDWFNMMTYDIHGTWDGGTSWSQSVVAPHTNLTGTHPRRWLCRSIDLWLALISRNGGRLGSPMEDPGCPFNKGSEEGTGGGAPGKCTGTRGVLSDREMKEIIDTKKPKVSYDEIARVKWMSWDSNQWY